MQNIYEPIPVKIQKIEIYSGDVKLFRMAKLDGSPFPLNQNGLVFVPGQFVLAGLWGYGESPFGPASHPNDSSCIEVVVRKVGQVTSALHSLEEGDELTLRGPYGNGYPIDFFREKDVILITGGCGIPPIASLVEYIISNRSDFGEVNLLYGATTPEDLLMKERMNEWKRRINVTLTVDKPACNWDGNTGFVTDCLEHLKINSANTVVAMCGPGPMVDAIENLLNPMGIPDRRIFVSMERKMQCGVGRCQHCVCGDKYVCVDGPVFNLDEIDKAWDK
ncbi:MAG: FAD/NAD(P)-binding protein [Parcubacteria group bacterium]|nr:FAD/NAD(P)-binding protein [Parcubacteria group bacterium]MCR4342947.1 FAD/NAD(P)-binding protein [Patescibacteria group bacterium]